MPFRLLPRGLTRQFVIVFILITLAGIVGVSLAAWQAERYALEEQVNSNLVMVANLKRERLRSWLAERQADAQLLAVNRLNQEHFTEMFDPGVAQERKNEFSVFLRDNLIGVQRSRSGYMEISMTDINGIVMISTNSERVGKAAVPTAARKLRVSSIDGSFFHDIFLHPDTGRPVMVFGHMIRSIDLQTHRPTPDAIGEVVIVVEMEETVFTFLGPMPDLGESAEALLVRPIDNGMLFLSRLLYVQNAPLNLTAGPNSPITAAARRAEMGATTSTFHSTDYSGEPVIAAYRQIEPVGWGLVVKQSSAEAFAPIDDLARQIVLLTTLVLLGTVVLAVFLARTLIRPIGALAQATQAIAQGDLSISLNTTRKDELGALAASFQKMVDALTERRQETQRLTDMLCRRADELESAYKDLRRSDDLKDAFIRNITHELRTPIATLAGFTELLMDDVDEFNPEQQEMLRAVASQSQQVVRLVNDVVALDNTEPESNARRPMRLAELMRAGVDAWRQRINGNNGTVAHELEFFCADDDVESLAHPGRMALILDNLLDNAIKFSPAGGVIHVQIRHVRKSDQDGQICDWQVVSVSDQGIGIAGGDLPHIWERFFQADNTTTRRFGGTGLGLALVKESVEAFGGQVWVDSIVGEGTTISFSIPVYYAGEPKAMLLPLDMETVLP